MKNWQRTNTIEEIEADGIKLLDLHADDFEDLRMSIEPRNRPLLD